MEPRDTHTHTSSSLWTVSRFSLNKSIKSSSHTHNNSSINSYWSTCRLKRKLHKCHHAGAERTRLQTQQQLSEAAGPVLLCCPCSIITSKTTTLRPEAARVTGVWSIKKTYFTVVSIHLESLCSENEWRTLENNVIRHWGVRITVSASAVNYHHAAETCRKQTSERGTWGHLQRKFMSQMNDAEKKPPHTNTNLPPP